MLTFLLNTIKFLVLLIIICIGLCILAITFAAIRELVWTIKYENRRKYLEREESYNAKELKDYRAIGLTPEQLKEVDRLYTKKCQEVSELSKKLEQEEKKNENGSI